MQSALGFLGTNGFIPHGYCLTWSAGLLWLHVLSDALIVLAYYSIPVTLLYFVRQRKDLPYPWLFTLFGLFIVACGTTHLLAIITVWIPLYWLDGMVKAVTAAISVVTALLMLWVIPRALMVRSPAQLEAEVQERRLTEVALQQNKEELQEAQRIAHMGSWRLEVATSHVVWSEEIYHIWGLKPDLPAPDYPEQHKLFTPESWKRLNTALPRTRETGIPYELELEIVRVDGSHGWMLARGEAIRDASGAIVTIHGMAMDITERKLAEEALRESESRHRLLVENSPVCIHEIDMDGRITSMNQAGLLMMGVEDECTVRGFLYLDAVCSADRERIEKLIIQAYAGETSHFEFKASGTQGQIFKSCFVPIRNREGHVEKLMGITEDVTARKMAEEEIHNLAFYDALTKVPNRRLFIDRFHTALIASARHNNFGAVLFIDLDRFKLLNDTFGHDYGDLLLVEVATRIKACVREMDTVARFGGDEFVVLIEDVSDNQDEAAQSVGLIAEKIRASLARCYDLGKHEHHCSPSIGVSLYRSNEETVDELLQHADMAMYQAKDSGRNAVRFFDPVMQNNVATRAALVNDLRNAIEQQLHLHYQLQVDNENRPVGAEALLRWVHPERGMIMPDQFLPIAEESTLILDIGDWVLKTACRQLASWSESEKLRALVLTVNISAKQFAMPDFVDKVASALRTHQINPVRLKLELTESMALDDLHSAVAKMHALKELGVRLSMDDFGTRYSSLSNLKQLPLDQIKLGRSFVQDVASDGNVALLVQSIIDMSSKYHITVIAEGVENDAQLTTLKDRDCVAYQGFLFSKALSIEEFEQLLKQS